MNEEEKTNETNTENQTYTVNYTKEDIKTMYNELVKEYDEIIANSENINNMLSNFVVNGSYIGAKAYGNNDGNISSYDIDLPIASEEYENAIRIVNADIEEIYNLITNIKQVLLILYQFEPDMELKAMTDDLEYKLTRLAAMASERENTVNELAAILNNLNYQKAFNNGQGSYGNGLSAGGGGGASGGGGGSSGGGGGSPSGGNYNSTNNNNDPNQQIEIGKGPVLDDYSNDGYKPLINFTSANDLSNIKATSASLAAQEQNTTELLKNIKVNGKVVGGEAYGLNGEENMAEGIEVDTGALYLAIDSVNSEIEMTEQLINQIKEQIAANEAEIEGNQNMIEAYEQVPEEICVGYDEDGNPIMQHNPAYDEAQAKIAELEQRNAELEAENTMLAEQQAEAEADKAAKEQSFNELVGLRNGLDKASGNILELYAGGDLLNHFNQNGDNAALYGMDLTNDQVSGMFGNLEQMLTNNQGKYSLSGNDLSGLTSTELTEMFNEVLNGSSEAKSRFSGYGEGKISLNPGISATSAGGSGRVFGGKLGKIGDLFGANSSDEEDSEKESKPKKYGSKLKNLNDLINGTGYVRTPGKLIIFNQKGYYDQNNNWHSWGNGQNGWNKSIAGSGCGPTSLATCLATMLNDPSITPATIANQMTNYGQNNGGGFMPLCSNYGLDYQMSGRYLHEQNADGSYSIDNFLARGGSLILSVKDSSHYVPIIGKDGSNYIVADPNASQVGQTMSLSLPDIDRYYGNHTMVMWIAPPGMSVSQAAAPLTKSI